MPEHPKRATAGGISLAAGVVALTTLLKGRPKAVLQAELLYGPVVDVQQDGSTVISFQILATGGVGPYTYSVLWGDGITGTSTNGYFTRTIPTGGTVPTDALVTVKSSDGQTVQIDG